VADIVPFLRLTLEGWKVLPEISQRASSDMEEIARFLRQHARLSGTVELSYSGTDMRTRVTYDGVHEVPLNRNLAPPATVENLDQFSNEEEVALVGLRDFLRSIAADRKHVSRRGGRLILKLRYEVP
jgi:hypothetical protein